MRLEFKGLSKQYGGQLALRDVTLTVPEFQSLAIIGPSGGGKTTLVRIIAGLETPEKGKIYFDGVHLDVTEQELLKHRRSIGTVFQAYNLFPHLTALENVILPLVHVHGLSPLAAHEVARSLFERFQLANHADHRPSELSGGQQQRVAIVRAIAIKPRFLIFDEPTSALDPEMTAEVLDVISELREEGRNLILVTHNMGFARKVSDQCLFIADGEVQEAGDTIELFTSPKNPQVTRFLDMVLRY